MSTTVVEPMVAAIRRTNVLAIGQSIVIDCIGGIGSITGTIIDSISKDDQIINKIGIPKVVACETILIGGLIDIMTDDECLSCRIDSIEEIADAIVVTTTVLGILS